MYRNYHEGVRYSVQPGDSFWGLAHQFDLTAEELYAANPFVNPYYLFVGQEIFIPTLNRQKDCISPREVELMRNERSLWEEHVAWTRMAIISLTFNLPDIEFILARLLKNATDMGDMFRPIYGDVAADTYATLIKEHLLIAADLVKAAIAGDAQAAETAERKWYQNADEIAVFLNSVNPYLEENEVRDMFYTHLRLTKDEAISMINKDYEKDIAIYDEIEKQAREMADMISDAMIKLYPDLQR
nr:LysM domain-containing protein [Paenibacillus bovis]